MTSLILSIFFTVFLFVCFKEFEKRDVNTHQAITINYITASLLAYIFYDKEIITSGLVTSEWIYPTIALGIFFVIMFNVMAITTQKLGISIASMASKISLIIPVFAALLLQNNVKFTWINGIGILLALIAVYLTFKKEEKITQPTTIAVILFFGAGILDMFLNYIQDNYLRNEDDFGQFIIVVFFVAFLVGLIKTIYSQQKIYLKNIMAGITLGIPNYLSIYFVIESLNKLGGLIVFPVLNIGVVLLSSILSSMIYKEYLSKLNWSGIVLACISIILILVF
tara:strand:- start:1122 stop:1964 length:843 start_codon:yes stop_codon:yes gene_type:complete